MRCTTNKKGAATQITRETPGDKQIIYKMTAECVVVNPQALWDTLSDDSRYGGTKYLQIVPDLSPLAGFEGAVTDGSCLIQLDNKETNRTEVFISKQTLVRMCAAAVRRLDEVLAEESDLHTWAVEKQHDVFLTTTVLLLASPENHTAIALHRDLLCLKHTSEKFLIAQEYTFLKTLLTCNSSRTNKSSSTWHLLRQVCLINEQRDNLFETVLRSATEHGNNYYGWSFARFYIHLEWFSGSKDMTQYYDMTKVFCKDKPQDTSAWTFLRDLQVLEMNFEKQTIFEEQVRGYLVGFNVSPLEFVLRYGPVIPQSTVDSDMLMLVDWIDKMEVVSYNPWLCMLPHLSASPLLTKIRQRVTRYESRYGTIELINGYHNSTEVDAKDVMMVRRNTVNANMKRVLAWAERIR